MDKEDTKFCIIFIILAFLLGLMLGAGICNDLWKADAITADIGEYVINPKTGAAGFKWKISNQQLPELKPKD